MKLKNKKFVELLKDREKVSKDGLPHFDEVQKIVTEVINNNIARIATDNELWKYLKPYVDEKEYKEANGKLGEVYRKLQKLEYKMSRLKDKITKELDKEDIKLKEFEEIGSVRLAGEEAQLDIIDRVEEYKKLLREKSEK